MENWRDQQHKCFVIYWVESVSRAAKDWTTSWHGGVYNNNDDNNNYIIILSWGGGVYNNYRYKT